MKTRYASTVHSAQGLARVKVIINLKTRSLTTVRDVYCVAVDRARHEAEIFTGDGTRLPAAVSRKAEKRTVLEMRPLQRHAEKAHTKDGPTHGGHKPTGKKQSGP